MNSLQVCGLALALFTACTSADPVEPSSAAPDAGGALPDTGGALPDAEGPADGGLNGRDADLAPDAAERDASIPDIRTEGALPQMEFSCAAPGSACGDLDPPMDTCNGLSLGEVGRTDPPCDRVLEIKNLQRDGLPTRDLVIDQLEILVKDFNHGLRSPPLTGAMVGLSLRAIDGTPRPIDPQWPLVVSIPPGEVEGRVRLLVRFSGDEVGLFRGEMSNNTGIRWSSNDPDLQPWATVPVTAIGVAPEIEVYPARVYFGPVEAGDIVTRTLTITNAGARNLELTDLRFLVDTTGAELNLRTDAGLPPLTLAASDSLEVTVRYEPSSTGPLRDQLLIFSDDRDEGALSIPVLAGSEPQLAVTPPDVLTFSTSPSTENLELANRGDSDLLITRVEIVGPGGDPSHPSVDDFSIGGCQAPCAPNWVLCAPNQPNCSSSARILPIHFDNNDVSVEDLAELHLYSNDPVEPEVVVVLNGAAQSCLFPTAAIEVETPSPTINNPVLLSALQSTPGSGAIVDYQWTMLFAPASPSLSPQGSAMTSFIPSVAGLYFVGLNVTNSCGNISAQNSVLVEVSE